MDWSPEKHGRRALKEKMMNGFRFNLLQKQHDLSIFQFLFAKLSLVRITPLLKNQRKILPSNVSLTSKLFVKLLTHY